MGHLLLHQYHPCLRRSGNQVLTRLEKKNLDVTPLLTACNSLHSFHIGWPCLSFDVVRDSLGLLRTDFPHTVYFVAGTQLRKVAHGGCINHMRAMTQTPHICASWSDAGYVQIWDFSTRLNALAELETEVPR